MAPSRGAALAILVLAIALLARPGPDFAADGTRQPVAGGQRPVLATAVTPRTDPPPAPPLEIRGSGWGHSVGLSQYGAQAQALDGRSAAEILGHYYPGTTLSAADSAAAGQPLRVGLFANRLDAGEVHVAARGRQPGPPTSPVRLRLSPGQQAHELPAGEVWRVRLAGGHYELVTPDGAVVDRGPGPVHAQPAAPAGANPGLLALPQLGTPGEHLAGTLQWGRVEITSHGGRMRPVLAVALEDYLRGVAEMASAWEPAALQAQAVIARTYAARRVAAGLQPACGCHLHATALSQVYTGYHKEGGPGGGNWTAAVQATRGRVATFRGRLAETVYSSSHGQRSEDADESWAFPASPGEHPYLRSVEDPWSADPRVANPHAAWTVEVGNHEFADLVAAETGIVRVASVGVAETTTGATPEALEVRGWDAAGEPAQARFEGQPSAGAVIHQAMRGRQPEPTRSQQLRAISLAPFADDDGSVHEYNIWALAAHGLTAGCGQGRYCPVDEVSRAEMASFLARMLSLDLDAQRPPRFADVASSVHGKAIDALVEVGLTDGCDAERYCPDEPVTRAQMASFLARAVALPEETPASGFVDVGGSVHQQAVEAVAGAGITSGCATGRFCPDEPVTRAQMASFLARALGVGW